MDNESELKSLIAASLVDGILDPRELAILFERAQELGISKEDLTSLITNTKQESYPLPEDKEHRIRFMWHLMVIILADEVISPEEKALFFKYLDQFEYTDEEKEGFFDKISAAVKEKLSFEDYLNDN